MMEYQTPRWIATVSSKLSWLSIPNIAFLICGLATLAFVAHMMWGVPLHKFVFYPQLFLSGEWWRAFAFPAEVTHPLWFLFFVLFVYFVVSQLEMFWGSSLITLFVMLSYFCALVGSLIVMRPASIWFHVIQNCGLAFGVLFPHVTFYLFFVIPVKAFWFALFVGGLSLWSFLVGDLSHKISMAFSFLPFFLFFGHHLYQLLQRFLKR